MSPPNLIEEIEIEVEFMIATLAELEKLQKDLSGRQPTTVEKVAAAAFMGQLYSGVENIMKRILMSKGIPIPEGPLWHQEVFQMFSSPPSTEIPQLIDKQLESDLRPYLNFRHIFVHGYGISLEWQKMREGFERSIEVFSRLIERIRDYLTTLK